MRTLSEYELWHELALAEAHKRYPGFEVYEVCEDGSVYLGHGIVSPVRQVLTWKQYQEGSDVYSF